MHGSILQRIWLIFQDTLFGVFPGSFLVFIFFLSDFQLFRPEHHWAFTWISHSHEWASLVEMRIWCIKIYIILVWHFNCFMPSDVDCVRITLPPMVSVIKTDFFDTWYWNINTTNQPLIWSTFVNYSYSIMQTSWKRYHNWCLGKHTLKRMLKHWLNNV
jgi:hypothetical protein